MLHEMADKEDEKGNTRHSPPVFAKKMCLFENAFVCVLWNKILHRFYETISFSKAQAQASVLLYHCVSSLRLVAKLREFDELENKAKNLGECIQQEYIYKKSRK